MTTTIVTSGGHEGSSKVSSAEKLRVFEPAITKEASRHHESPAKPCHYDALSVLSKLSIAPRTTGPHFLRMRMTTPTSTGFPRAHRRSHLRMTQRSR